MNRFEKIKPGPGQESVWDYPRPPALRRCDQRVRILLRGETLADTSDALCVLETSHPPTYYLPPGDIDMRCLREIAATSVCEWKGAASYYDIVCEGETHPRTAWTYHHPTPAFAALKDHVAFYAHVMDACYVGEEKVIAQPGNFYGGWITSDVVGPFKGEPGTMWW
ncbi:MAG: DUF427 domain-containing protein [Gammaproteobacteria bacterium]|nr:DUF427 domain-containing protein [Gammaproteobacteria bacterium]